MVSLVALATLLFFNGPGDKESRVLLKDTPSTSKLAKVLPKTSNSKVVDQDSDETSNSLSHPEAAKWANVFLDANQSMEARLEAWVNLQKMRPIPVDSFIQIARSKNPYDGTQIKPHSIDEQNFKREESFRIMALQSLEKASLEDPTQISTLLELAKSASSPVIKKIAGKMREFAEKGLSYSDMAGQALLQSEIPN